MRRSLPSLAVGLLAASTGLAQAQAQAEAEADALVPGQGFEVVRYEARLRPDLATTAIAGSQVIVLKGTGGGATSLVFSPNALRIANATLDGRPVTATSMSQGIVFALPAPLRAGQSATLRFELAGTPARGVQAIAAGLYTSYFACDWMVCLQDAPDDKADLALDLELPAGATSLGVGRELPKQVLDDGRILHRWRSARPYPAYLFGFAAGDFPQETVRSGEGTFAYLDGSGEGRALRRDFALTPSIARFFADKAGIALPDRRYAQLLVPGSEAQEAATFSLIGADELDRDLVQPASAWLIAHELAHQWWGNLVTCASWREFWLNEGIATFMVAAWKEQALGADAYREELALARTRLRKARDAGFDKPLAWAGKYPSLGVRRAVQYGKGALFLDHLRSHLGDDAFWRGIRDYTRRHAGGTVTSRDFQRAMERASGRDLQPLFVEWVYGS